MHLYRFEPRTHDDRGRNVNTTAPCAHHDEAIAYAETLHAAAPDDYASVDIYLNNAYVTSVLSPFWANMGGAQ